MKRCPNIDREYVCTLNGLICPFEDAVNCPEVTEDELIDDTDKYDIADRKYHERKEG